MLVLGQMLSGRIVRRRRTHHSTGAARKVAQRRLALRVRRAWRVTSKVEVLWPGLAAPAVRPTPLRRAEGKEKSKGVAARRGLKEAQSKAAGR